MSSRYGEFDGLCGNAPNDFNMGNIERNLSELTAKMFLALLAIVTNNIINPSKQKDFKIRQNMTEYLTPIRVALTGQR